MNYLTGYISSRPINGNYIPQKVQNILAREYCKNNNYVYYMGAAEFMSRDSFSVLKSEISRLCKSEKEHKGIVCYSIDMLPSSDVTEHLVKSIIKRDKSLHFFLEDLCVSNPIELLNLLDLLRFKRNSISIYSF